MPQTVEHDTRELWVCVLPFQELLTDEYRLYRQTVGQRNSIPLSWQRAGSFLSSAAS